MKKILFLFTLMLCTCYMNAQGFDYNQQKYWKYRELLKNFVVVGDCQGCSLPAGGIDLPGSLSHGDETTMLGNYIGFLAMEHKLLRTQSGSGYTGNTDVNTKELFYALEAFNRLDKMAEPYWDQYGYNYTGYPIGGAADLNGFFIRDDIPYNWLDQTYQGQSIENTLGDHYGPFDWHNEPYIGIGLTKKDNYRRKMGQNGLQTEFTRKDYLNNNTPNRGPTAPGGPTEESLDQVVEFIKGIALTVKLVDANLTYVENGVTKTFSDGETNIVAEAKKISHRIASWCQAYQWIITNPVTGMCAKGLEWGTYTCENAGAVFADLSAGLALTDAYIQTGYQSSANAAAYFNLHYGSDPVVQTSLNGPWGYYAGSHHPGLSQENKVLTLAALSNIWGAQTNSILAERSNATYENDMVNFPHIPLMHALLHGSNNTTPNSVYECMLDQAAFDGQHANDGNYEWSNSRVLYGPNTTGTTYSDELNEIDYLFYYDMYCCYNSSYMNTYRRIDPLQLLPVNLTKTGQKIVDPNTGLIKAYKEWDFRRYAAVRTITVGNIDNFGEYHIRQYDGDAAGVTSGQEKDVCKSSQPGNYKNNRNSVSITCNYDQLESQDETFVEFLAGESVTFKPGFTIDNGGQMHAHLQNGLGNMTQQTSENKACSNCVAGGSESAGIEYTGYDKYRVYKFKNGELFVLTPHVLFKIREEGYVGENMFDLIQKTSPCPSAYNIGSDVPFLLGFQRFSDDHNIVDVDYIQGYTFVSFDDGKIIKIDGTGGGGENMFGMTDNGFFNNITGYNYFVAHNDFDAELVGITTKGNDILVAINNGFWNITGHILKFTSVGGSCSNCGWVTGIWDVNTTGSGYIMGGDLTGYQEFYGKITAMEFVNSNLYVCTRNGGDNFCKILKVAGSGGTGQNMFDINEFGSGSSFAFEDDPYYGAHYYIGDQKFDYDASYVTAFYSFPYNGHTYIALGLKNGKALLVKDGGTGHYMFNVEETDHCFDLHSSGSTDYRVGCQDFSNGPGSIGNQGFISDFAWITDAGNPAGGYLFIGFHNGNLRKTDVSSANTWGGGMGSTVGFADFNMAVSSCVEVNNKTFVALTSGQMIKVQGSAGTGNNFMAVAYIDEGPSGYKYYKGICGYDYYIGSENLDAVCAGKHAIHHHIDSNYYYMQTNADSAQLAAADALLNQRNNNFADADLRISVWPNPANNSLNIMVTGTGNGEAEIEVDDVTGHSLNKIMVNLNRQAILGVTDLGTGMYYLKCRNINTGLSKTIKFIKQ